MSHPLASHHCTGVSRLVYILTYEQSEWRVHLSETAGTEVRDGREACGVLGVYATRELAEEVGDEWAGQQVDNEIEAAFPPYETEEERMDAQADFGGWSLRENGRWESGYRNRDSLMQVVVEEWRVLSSVAGIRLAGDEEEEESSDDEGSEGEEVGEKGGEEAAEEEALDEDIIQMKGDDEKGKDQELEGEKEKEKEEKEKEEKEKEEKEKEKKEKEEKEKEAHKDKNHESVTTNERRVEEDSKELTLKRKRENGNE